MAVDQSKTVSYVPEFGARDDQLARKINGIINGKVNSVGEFTLTALTTSTVVTDRRVGVNTKIMFAPETANAAGEIGTGGMYISAKAKEQFTVTHANNGQSDRTFGYIAFGP